MKEYAEHRKFMVAGLMMIAVLSIAGCGKSNDALVDNPNQQNVRIESVRSSDGRTQINDGLTEAVYVGYDKYLSGFVKDGKKKVATLQLQGSLMGDEPLSQPKDAGIVVSKVVYHNIKVTYAVGSLTNSGLALAVYPALNERRPATQQEEENELKTIEFIFDSSKDGSTDYFHLESPGKAKLTPNLDFAQGRGLLSSSPVMPGDVIFEKVKGGIQVTYMINGQQKYSNLIEGNFYGMRPKATSNAIQATMDIYQ